MSLKLLSWLMAYRIFDLGGGTLDVSVLEIAGTSSISITKEEQKA